MTATRILLIVTAALLLAGVQAGLGEQDTADAAFPGDNGRVAFWNIAGVSTIASDGSGETLVVQSQQTAPRWSPDGERIVYATLGVGGGEDIFVVNADGSGMTNLTERPGVDWQPSWSPDGESIIFVRDVAGDRELWVMDSDGSNAKQLTDFETPGFALGASPAWSPDGESILLVGSEGGSSDLYTVAADGTGLKNLTNTPEKEIDPDWSPDGGQIVFTAFTTVSPRDDAVFVMDSDGSGRKQVSDGLGTGPAWSPDGTAIVYSAGAANTVTTIAPDGSGEKSLEVTGFNPDWQPLGGGIPPQLSGDVNCDGTVDAVDALQVARFVAALPVFQNQPCPVIGEGQPFGHGDVNCSGSVDAVDALFILRHVAGLPVNLPQGCREIGT